MPPKKQYKKRSTRKRKGYRRNRVSNITSNPIPQSFTVRMRYNDQLSLNPTDTSATAAYNTYNLASIYDPDWTNGGIAQGQPYGYDQWMNLYTLYTVIGAKISVRAMGYSLGDGDQQNSGVFGIHLDETTAPLSATTAYMTEARNSRHKIHDMDLVNKKPVVMTYSPRKYWKAKAIVGQDIFGGYDGGSPVKSLYAQVFYGSRYADSVLTEERFEVNIEYLVVFTSPKEFALS